MAEFNKFQQFVEDLALGVHNLNTGTLNIYLSNTTPNAASHATKSDLAEISTGGGYSGPIDTENSASETGGTLTVTAAAKTITATSGGVATFRYVVLYNDTPTSPTDPLIGWWDRGATLDLDEGDTFTWKPNNSDSTGTLLTLA